MACDLVEESNSQVSGLTLWGSNCSRPTALYFPRREMVWSSKIDVMLWFHGYFVSDFKAIFKHHSDNNPDKNSDCRLRQSVLKSQQDLVIVAPFLGHVPYAPGKDEIRAATTQEAKDKVAQKVQAHAAGAGRYKSAEQDLGKDKHAEAYLQGMLDAIGAYRAKLKASPPPATGSAAAPAKAIGPSLGNLYLACHSGGGEGMLDMLDSLGGLSSKLKECWGFDCIYSTAYAAKGAANPKVKFYLYVGRGSSLPSSYALFKAKYGTPKAPLARNIDNLFVAPATDGKWVGVDDDSRAFQSLVAIARSKPTALSHEQFRRDLDATLGDRDRWVNFMQQHKLKLKDHYTVPASLLEPRIRQSVAKAP